MLSSVAAQDLSGWVVFISMSVPVLDLLLLRELSILGRKHRNIAKLVDIIAKVAYQMHLNKVEM